MFEWGLWVDMTGKQAPSISSSLPMRQGRKLKVQEWEKLCVKIASEITHQLLLQAKQAQFRAFEFIYCQIKAEFKYWLNYWETKNYMKIFREKQLSPQNTFAMPYFTFRLTSLKHLALPPHSSFSLFHSSHLSSLIAAISSTQFLQPGKDMVSVLSNFSVQLN